MRERSDKRRLHISPPWEGKAVNLALLASDSALADKASASETLYYIITAGQRSAVVHVPPHVLGEGDAVNLASLATTARLCAQRSAEGHTTEVAFRRLSAIG